MKPKISTTKDLHWYLERIGHLRVDRAHGLAPHKPILLLAVIEMIEEGLMRENQIPFSPELVEIFRRYWTRLTHRSVNAVMPFFHLQSDQFWHLHANLGYEAALKSSTHMRAVAALMKIVRFASLDEELFLLLKNRPTREMIRKLIIDTYFNDSRTDVESSISQGKRIREYQTDLIDKAKKRFHVRETSSSLSIEFREVRNPAFRRMIMSLYQYTCSVCGLRIITLDGLSAVDAGHIVPFSVSQNDDPRNGIGLCKIHHWAFDNGLIAIDDKYRLRVSETLDAKRPTEWLFTKLESESVILPLNSRFHPSQEALRWHRANRFRK